MKKIFIFLLGLLSGVSVAQADVVQNYTYDFEQAFGAIGSDKAYTDPSAAPTGWTHIPDGVDFYGYGTYTYPTYKFDSTHGRESSGCLYVDQQRKYDNWSYEYHYFHDYLITPKLTGTAKLWVKLYSSNADNSFVELYKATESSGSFTVGDKITYTGTPAADQWVEISVADLQGEYIAIRASQAYLDDFSADQAEVVLRPSLLITGESNMSTYHDVDDEGNYTLSWKVVLENNGPVDIAANAYNLALVLDGDTLKKYPIAQDIAQGAKSDTITIDYPVNIKDYPNSSYKFTIVETASGNAYSPSSITLTPAKSIVDFKQGYYSLANGATINFGSSPKAASSDIIIQNTGGKAATFTTVTFPEGYTASKAVPFDVAAHAKDTLTITRTADPAGMRMGDLTVASADTTLTIHLVGSTVSSDVWYEDFESNSIPSSFVAGAWSTDYFPQNLKIVDDKYGLKSGNSTTRLITPKLDFAEAGKLQFDAASASSKSGNTFEGDLKVYYSADRKTWTLAGEVTADSTNTAAQHLSTAAGGSYGYYYQALPYTVDIPAGTWYIAFDGDHVYLDNIAGGKQAAVKHDLYITDESLPTKGEINSALPFTVTVQNLGVDEPAGSYKAVLYINGEVADTAEAVAINAGKTATFTFSYTPHAEGTLTAKIALEGDSVSAATEEVTITVAAESAEKTLLIGTPSTSEWSGTVRVPVYGGSYKLSQAELVYDAQQLGFGAGTKIKSIAFVGTSSGTATYSIEAKIGNSSNFKFSYPYAFTDTTGWQTIHSGDYTFTAADPAAKILTIDLAEPFVYDGTNLHLFFDNKLVSDKGVSLYFTKNDNTEHCTAAYRNTLSDAYADDDDVSSTNAPIIYLTIEQTPKVLSGKVTTKAGEAIAGAPVTLTSGDIVYSATTDQDGQYSITVFKFDQTYVLNASAEGYMPHVVEDFTISADSTLNIALQEAKGFYIAKSNVPATATVNHPYTATVTVQNVETAAIDASKYTAKLYVGDEVVATAEPTTVEAGASADFTFTYTPHADATTKAYVVFEITDDAVTTTDTVSLVIAPESLGGLYQLGDSTSMGSMDRAPASFYYKSSKSATIYPADIISIPQGAKITRIYYKGYTAKYGDTYDAKVQVWLQNTEDAAYTDNGEYSVDNLTVADSTDMTKVYDGIYHVEKAQGSSDAPVIVLDIPLTEAFTYEGRNLKVVVWQTNANSDGSCCDTKYVSDSSYPKGTYIAQKDDDLDKLTSWYQRNMPVAYIEAEAGATVSGSVKDSTGVAIAGATVTLTAGDVVYTGTTDADGNYNIVVAQADKTYATVVAAEGYVSDSTETSFADGNVTYDVVLKKDVPTAISELRSDLLRNAQVFDLQGHRLNAPRRGVNIIRLEDGMTRKVVVK